MEHPNLGWGARIALLSQWYSIRLARKQRLELRQSMTSQQWEALLARADESSRSLDLTNVPDQVRSFLFSPQSMLCHPLLVHYIRPAMRLASAAGYVTSDIPVAFSAFTEDALVRIEPGDIRKKGKVPKNGSLFFSKPL
jgi:hypothetical protein